MHNLSLVFFIDIIDLTLIDFVLPRPMTPVTCEQIDPFNPVAFHLLCFVYVTR